LLHPLHVRRANIWKIFRVKNMTLRIPLSNKNQGGKFSPSAIPFVESKMGRE